MSFITLPKSISIGKEIDVSECKRSIAYSMDLLIPGLYVWAGNYTLRVFGETPDDKPYKYPGTLNSNYGIALVLPSYQIFTTYKDSYDPR
jgi:hypothetical protein